jgi:hypothetical protein
MVAGIGDPMPSAGEMVVIALAMVLVMVGVFTFCMVAICLVLVAAVSVVRAMIFRDWAALRLPVMMIMAPPAPGTVIIIAASGIGGIAIVVGTIVETGADGKVFAIAMLLNRPYVADQLIEQLFRDQVYVFLPVVFRLNRTFDAAVNQQVIVIV